MQSLVCGDCGTSWTEPDMFTYLDDGENKPTTRNRLKSAAERRNLTITIR